MGPTFLPSLCLILLVSGCGIANCRDSSLYKHDFYGQQFQNSYLGPNHLPPYVDGLSYLDKRIPNHPWDGTANDLSPPRKVFHPDVPVNPRGASPNSVTDAEILQLTEDLYDKENSYLDKIAVNIQGKTRSVDTNDQAPEPLLEVSEKALRSPTIAKMLALFDNYEMDTSIDEIVTPQELQEEDDFLEAVMATSVMRQAMLFLQNKGIVSSNRQAQRQLLKTIWFTIYSRGQRIFGSSGFEHVFLNEINRGKLIGLHNWVYFNEEEKAGHLDYKGYLNKIDLGNKGKIIGARFTYNGLVKPVNTMFVGTSPELELALYTVCFELRADEVCPVSMGGKKFTIQTNTWRYNGMNLIGSAFPRI